MYLVFFNFSWRNFADDWNSYQNSVGIARTFDHAAFKKKRITHLALPARWYEKGFELEHAPSVDCLVWEQDDLYFYKGCLGLWIVGTSKWKPEQRPEHRKVHRVFAPDQNWYHLGRWMPFLSPKLLEFTKLYFGNWIIPLLLIVITI